MTENNVGKGDTGLSPQNDFKLREMYPGVFQDSTINLEPLPMVDDGINKPSKYSGDPMEDIVLARDPKGKYSLFGVFTQEHIIETTNYDGILLVRIAIPKLDSEIRFSWDEKEKRNRFVLINNNEEIDTVTGVLKGHPVEKSPYGFSSSVPNYTYEENGQGSNLVIEQIEKSKGLEVSEVNISTLIDGSGVYEQENIVGDIKISLK
jgi:hypothetical protein